MFGPGEERHALSSSGKIAAFIARSGSRELATELLGVSSAPPGVIIVSPRACSLLVAPRASMCIEGVECQGKPRSSMIQQDGVNTLKNAMRWQCRRLHMEIPDFGEPT